ncbi:hypothetical protein OXX79_006950 [Metschnikowia pulcherrima]
MIVLPNTPSTPKSLNVSNGKSPQILSSKTLALRASINVAVPENHAELTQYMLRLEQYLDAIFEDLASQNSGKEYEKLAAIASDCILSASIPWKNVNLGKSTKSLRVQKPTLEWSLSAEITATAIAMAQTYMRLGADLTNELVEETEPAENGAISTEIDQKWRSVAEFYKSAISLVDFGQNFQAAIPINESAPLLFNPSIFALFDKICNIGIQMSILCKSSWLNRASLSGNDTLSSSNNGVLCRVAIWVFNEVMACQNLISEMEKSGPEYVHLNYDGWREYLSVFFKYVTAYSGLFLAIENYQQQKLGQAIGLLNFSLVALQSKNMGDDKKRVRDRLKNRFSGRKNDKFIASLQSVTALNIDKSVFSGSSGAMLGDLSLLFDQIVLLHLKFTKENDNLNFEAVASWKDTRADSKWPLGAKIPVSPPKQYLPRSLSREVNAELVVPERKVYY